MFDVHCGWAAGCRGVVPTSATDGSPVEAQEVPRFSRLWPDRTSPAGHGMRPRHLPLSGRPPSRGKQDAGRVARVAVASEVVTDTRHGRRFPARRLGGSLPMLQGPQTHAHGNELLLRSGAATSSWFGNRRSTATTTTAKPAGRLCWWRARSARSPQPGCPRRARQAASRARRTATPASWSPERAVDQEAAL
jgi:hypothetical protein